MTADLYTCKGAGTAEELAELEARGFWFDEEAAQAAVNFFDRVLVHVKGEWAGQPFTLSDWQRDQIVRPLFGWKRQDGSRRYRTAYIEIPRKNGKSSLAAGIALFMLFADGEPGAEVYSAAADRNQAAIVFDVAKQMTEAAPILAKRAEPFKRSILCPATMGSYRVLSADAPTKHGLNASAVVVDELHAQPNRELVDVLVTSTGARRQPLIVFLTTAGFNLETICGEYHEYAIQVRDGVIEDDTFLPVLYAADPGDDWQDPDVWAKANPGLGVSVKVDYLANEARRAAAVPAYQNTFRRLHLNEWTEQDTRWLPMDAWGKCARPFDPELLEGARCYGGLDLASTSDLASLALVFPSEPGEPEDYAIRVWFWIPADNITDRARRDRVPYDAWTRDGLITATEGNVIDYSYIVRDIEALGERFDIQEIAFDRWGAFQVSTALEGLGFTMVGFGQGFASMGSPTKELMRLVLAERIRHNSNKVLNWMAANMVVSSDAAGNVKPNKAKSREKIDGMVSLIMGLGRAIVHREDRRGSVYDRRGIISL